MGCRVYGQETINIELQTTDTNDCILANGVDWTVSDENIDGSDNTLISLDNGKNDSLTKSFASDGDKTIAAVVEFDDGWGNIYTHSVSTVATAYPYDSPVLDFSWVPVNPTVLNTSTFTQNHTDTRDANNTFGEIVSVEIDYRDDGANLVDTTNNGDETEASIQKDEQFYKRFSSFGQSIPIKLTATYWDGWQNTVASIIKNLQMSNIPPNASYDKENGSVCVPKIKWISSSSDVDGDDSHLTNSWELSIIENGSSSIVDTHSGAEYTYSFQIPGNYKLVLYSEDLFGGIGETTDTFSVEISECTVVNSSGSCEEAIRLAIADYKRSNPVVNSGNDEGSRIIIVDGKRHIDSSVVTMEKDLDGIVLPKIVKSKLGSTIEGSVGYSPKSSMSGRVKGTLGR